MSKPSIDRVLFFTAAAAAVSVCIPLGLFPEQAELFVSDLYDWIAANFGVFYQMFAAGTIVFLIWLTMQPFGKVRLGGDGERPEFSTFSWIGMLFCAGTGATLLVWSGVEWAYYIDSPPFGAVPRSTTAIEWATAYGPFHWGIAAWSFYALPTIAIAYPYYVKKVPRLRASTSLHSILGPSGENSIVGRAVDLAAMIALLGGAAIVLPGALFMPRVYRNRFAVGVSILSLLGGFAAALTMLTMDNTGFGIVADALRRDHLAELTQVILIGTGLIVVLISINEDSARRQPGEFYRLLLAAVAGMAFFVAANNLLTLFLGLEWFSICLYILSAIATKRERSLEAGLKYLIIGSFGSAILLFGSALVFGATGALGFEAIAATASRSPSSARSTAITFAPSWANRVAVARPIPDATPVTTATLSASRSDMSHPQACDPPLERRYDRGCRSGDQLRLEYHKHNARMIGKSSAREHNE